MTDAIRTPDELFEGLPDFPFAAHFDDIGGVRIARVDEGDGAPVVMLHGEPTWSYLYRKVLPPVRDAGFRVICPDLAGFGRSDKPIDFDWYSYDAHTAVFKELVQRLELRDATLVCHDWGGPIGMRAAVELPECFARIVVLDTGFFTGEQRMTEAWLAFRNFVERTEDLPIGMLVRGACKTDPGDAVIAAYEAPFPSVASKAGARAFPLMLPTSPDAPGAAAGRAVRDALAANPRPTLVLWADSDPIIPVKTGERIAEIMGAAPPTIVPDASHFLQEDQGELIGRHIADWLTA